MFATSCVHFAQTQAFSLFVNCVQLCLNPEIEASRVFYATVTLRIGCCALNFGLKRSPAMLRHCQVAEAVGIASRLKVI
jgi:hypothetical protein